MVGKITFLLFFFRCVHCDWGPSAQPHSLIKQVINRKLETYRSPLLWANRYSNLRSPHRPSSPHLDDASSYFSAAHRPVSHAGGDYRPHDDDGDSNHQCEATPSGKRFRRIEELALQRVSTPSPGLEGLAMADFNGDGVLDHLLCNMIVPFHLRDRAPSPPLLDFSESLGHPYLLLGTGDGAFIDATLASGLTQRNCSAVVSADIDNDGDADLLTTYVLDSGGEDGCYAFLNDGHGKFVELPDAFDLCAAYPASLAIGDVNNDGFLDAYSPSFNEPGGLASSLTESVLLLGDGTGRLTRMRNSGAEFPRWPCFSSFMDMDDDGDADLVVGTCNEHDAAFQPIPGPIYMYRNTFAQNGIVYFEDAVDDYGVGLRKGVWMSTAFGDYNGDGLLDLYMGNGGCLYPVAIGNFPNGTTCADFVHVLLRNNGDGTYTDVADDVKVAERRFNWGGAFVDVDNDGNHDLITVGNGTPDPRMIAATLAGLKHYSPGTVFLNRGYEFEPVEEFGIVTGTGLAIGDVDGDGLVDVSIQKLGLVNPVTGIELESADAVLMLNTNKDGNAWLKVRLQGTTCNRDAIGAKVRVWWRSRVCHYGSDCRCRWERRVQVRAVVAGSSFWSSHEKVITFGLGRRGAWVDVIEVQWPDGKRQRVNGRHVAVNRLIEIKESRYL